MLRRFLAWIRDAGAPTEEKSDRDGLLSYALEWHALTLGIGAGLASGLTNNPELLVIVIGVAVGVRAAPTKRLKQLRREPWYAVGGSIIGYGVSLVGLLG